MGKSTLFNRLAGQGRKALTVDRPGMTRDRKYATVSWSGVYFEIIDTGGFVVKPKESMLLKIKAQVDRAMEESDLFLFLTDVREGYTVLDQEIYSYIRALAKPIIGVVNKVDTDKWMTEISDFFRNGCPAVLPISAENIRGIDELLDRIIEILPRKVESIESVKVAAKICVIGRPNVGKSSLVNRLIADDRLIVSATPGTTRDSVDIDFNFKKKCYRIVDTAGLRKKRRGREITEELCYRMAIRSIKKADIALLVIDAADGITSQDTAIGGLSHQHGKGLVILMNKWDLPVKDTHTMTEFEKERQEKMKFLSFAPSLYVSAKTGLRISKIMGLVEQIVASQCRRIPTPQLNAFLKNMHNAGNGTAGKIQYITQTGIKPPHFVLFTNRRSKLPMNYIRFIRNQICEHFNFFGTPLMLSVKTRKGKQTTA